MHRRTRLVGFERKIADAIEILSAQDQVAKHAGDSLCALGQLNHQIPNGFDAFSADDNLFENLFVVGVVALAIVGKFAEQEFVGRLPKLSLRA